MPERAKKPKPKGKQDEVGSQDEAAKAADTAEVDDLLDEIDEVLEENAEEFVRSYVQKGGQ